MRALQRPVPPDDGVAAAIQRVLALERDAQQQVDAAQQRAEDATAAGRARARAVLDRAAVRIAAAHRSVERRIAGHEARAAAEIARLQPDATLSPADLAALDAAVATLARELAGGADA